MIRPIRFSLSVAFCAILFLSARPASAALFTYTSGTVTETFDNLGTGGLSTTLLTGAGSLPNDGTSGWFIGIVSAGTGNTTSTSVATTTINAVSSGGTAVNNPAARMFNNGGDSNGTGDRALGTGNTGGDPVIDLAVKNTTGGTITSITVTYNTEFWRSGTLNTSPLLNDIGYTFLYSPTGAASTWSSTGATIPQRTAVASATDLDGNVSPNIFSTSVTYTLPTPVANNGTFFLRWWDTNDPNNSPDSNLAIDNVTFTATFSVPTVLTWNTPAGGTWDQVVANKPWLNASLVASQFTNGDTVNFTQAGVQAGGTAITVGAAVNPSVFNITNSTETYTFTGSAITGPLSKTNGGTAIFASANTFSSITSSGGIVELQNTFGTTTSIGLSGSATVKMTGTTAQSTSGVVTMTGNGTIETSGAGTRSLSSAGWLVLGGNTLTVRVGATSGQVTLGGNNAGTAGTSTATSAGILEIENNSGTTVLLRQPGTGFAGTLKISNGVVTNDNTGGTFMEQTTAVLDIGATGTFDISAQTEGLAHIKGAAGSVLKINNADNAIRYVGATSYTFAGSIQNPTAVSADTNVLVRKDTSSASTWTLSGLSTYDGRTEVIAGGLTFNTIKNVSGGASALGAPTNASRGTVMIRNGATLTYNGDGTIALADRTSDRAFALSSTAGTANLAASGISDLILTGGISGATTGAWTLNLRGTGNGEENGAIALGTATSLAVTKLDGGKWTLGGTNTYGGATTISGGTLALAAAGTIANSTTVTVGGSTFFDVTAKGAGGYTIPTGQTLNGTGTVQGVLKTGAGAIVNPGTSPGTLNISGDLSAGGGTFNFELSPTDTTAGGANNDLIAVSGTNGNIATTATTTINVTGAAGGISGQVYTLFTYTGTSSATLNTAGGFVLGTTPGGRSTYTLQNGTGSIQLNVSAATPHSLRWSGAGSGNWQVNTPPNNWYDVTAAAAGDFFDQDNVTFSEEGNPSTVPSNTNPITITGTVQPGSMTIDNVASTYVFQGSGVIGGAGTLTKKSAGTATINNSTANTFSGLTDVQGGLLNLNNTGGNSLGGSLTVSGGTARLQANNQIANGGTVTVSSGTLDMQTFTDAVAGVVLSGGSITGTGTGAITSTAQYDLQSGSISAIMAGTAGAKKSTGGTVTLTGAANTFTGTLDIQGGTLDVQKAQAPTVTTVDGATTILRTQASNAVGSTAAQTVTMTNGAKWELNGAAAAAQAHVNNITVGAGNALIDVNNNGTNSLTGLVAVGANHLKVTVNSSAGQLTLLPNGTSTATFNASTPSYLEIFNDSSNEVLLNNVGDGFHGDLLITKGNVRNNVNGSFLPNDTVVSISAGAKLDLTGQTAGEGLGWIEGAGDLVLPAGATVGTDVNVNLNTNTITGQTRTLSGIISQGATAGTGSLTLNTTTAGATWQLTGLANTYAGATTVTAGTLEFKSIADANGTSSSLGAPTTVANGTIAVGTAGVLKYTGTGGHSSNRVISLTGVGGGGTIDASGTGSALVLSGGVTGTNTNLNLRGTGTAEQNGAIATGTGTLTKNDGGIWKLGGTNTYGGLTTVSGGELEVKTGGSIANGGASVASTATLRVNGTMGSGLVSVSGTLKGSGTIGGAVTLNAGGVFSPGNSPGTMTTGAQTWGAAGVYDWEIDSASAVFGTGQGVDPGHDWLHSTANINITATSGGGQEFVINIKGLSHTTHNAGVVTGFNNAVAYDWVIATADTGLGGTFAANKFVLNDSGFILNNPLGGGSFSIVQGPSGVNGTANDVILHFAPAVGTTQGKYDLISANTGGILNVLKGGKIPVSAQVTNVGTLTDDAITYNGLTNTSSADGTILGTAIGPGTLAQTQSATNSALKFQGTGYNTSVTITPVATVNNATLGGAAQNIVTTTVTVNVGEAKALASGASIPNDATFNTAMVLKGIVGTTESFAGLASRTTSPQLVPLALTLGTEATITQGRNNTAGDITVSMRWRDRANSEKFGTATSPPIFIDDLPNGLISDVVKITGMGNGGLTSGDRVETDPFALQMSYTETELKGNEALLALAGKIKLAWLDTDYDGVAGASDSDLWKLATLGNFGPDGVNTSVATKNFQGSWADFLFSHPSITDANVGTYLGSYGVDIADNVVWAVVNHNSQFAAIPEPSTIVLFGLGGLGLLTIVRRRKARVA